jgi:hypothetical protein
MKCGHNTYNKHLHKQNHMHNTQQIFWITRNKDSTFLLTINQPFKNFVAEEKLCWTLQYNT